MEYDGVYGVQKSSSKVIRVLHKRKNQIAIKNGPKSLNKMPYEKQFDFERENLKFLKNRHAGLFFW